MSRFTVLLAVAFLGCKDKDGEQTPTETGGLTDTGVDTVPPPEPPTWQVTNQFGNILAVHTLPGKGADELFTVQAVFAKALDQWATAAGCMVRDGLCLEALPTQPDTFFDTEAEFDLERNYTWNGFEIGVDTIAVPFINDIDDAVQYYDFSIDAPPLVDNPVVSFSGEWGSYTGDDLIVPTLELIEPAPTDNIDVTDGFGTIRWNPGGKGEPYLRIVANDLNRVYLLEDDGEYELDYDALPLDAGERPDLFVGRWSVREADVNGNQLTMTGITEQPCGTQVCDDFPVANLNGSSSGGNLGNQPHFLGVGSQALIYDSALYDFNFDGTTLSAALIFTVYDATYAPLCTVTYDASTYALVQWPTDNGLALWQGWSIDLFEGEGISTCGRVDAAVFGTEDIRVYIETAFDWGIGIGEMSAEFETALADLFGAQWPVFQPTIHSVYVSSDGLTASEMSYGRNIDLVGCYTADKDLAPDDFVPSGPNLPDSLYLSAPVYTIAIQ